MSRDGAAVELTRQRHKRLTVAAATEESRAAVQRWMKRDGGKDQGQVMFETERGDEKKQEGQRQQQRGADFCVL